MSTIARRNPGFSLRSVVYCKQMFASGQRDEKTWGVPQKGWYNKEQCFV